MSTPPVAPRLSARLLARTAAVVAGALTVLAGAFVVAAPAAAHDELLGASPAADSRVETLPGEIVLTFSGVLLDQPGATEVVVTDAAGTALTDGAPILDGTKLTQPLTTEGAQEGPVTVTWRVVSSDGHPISNRYSFTYGDGTAVVPSPAATASEPPMAATDMTWMWVVGGLVLIALVAGAGMLLIRRSRPHGED